MNGPECWREDARTDRAIELLRLCAAKTDASGKVVPRHRYSRHLGAVAERLQDLSWRSRSELVTMALLRHGDGRPTTVRVEIEVEDADGNVWEQTGTVTSDEDSYCWYALAACRALLHYARDDGTPMTPDEVIALLEKRRDEAMRAAGVRTG